MVETMELVATVATVESSANSTMAVVAKLTVEERSLTPTTTTTRQSMKSRHSIIVNSKM